MTSDLLSVLRGLGRRPGLALPVVLSLALGIAATATVYQLVEAVFLRTLPVAEPDRLVWVFGTDETHPGLTPLSHPNFEDLDRRLAGEASLAAYQWTSAVLTADEEAERVYGQIVSPDFFEVLALPVAPGRSFTREDDRGAPLAVVAEGFARQRYGSPEAALGQTLELGGLPFTVIGVAPPSFQGVGALGIVARFWVPMGVYDRLSSFPGLLEARHARMFGVVGRRGGGAPAGGTGPSEGQGAPVSFDQLRGRLAAEGVRLAEAHPEVNRRLGVEVVPLSHAGVDPAQRGTYLAGAGLLAAVALLLLGIAAANAVILLQIRAADRRRETAVRLALGAGVGAVVRRPLLEGLVLALAGGLLGLVLTGPALALLWNLRPPFLAPGSLDLGLGAGRLGFTLALALVVGATVALGPALQARRRDLVSALKSGEAERPGATTLRRPSPWILLQGALGALALATAALFLQGLEAQTAIDLGVDTEHLLLVDLDLRQQDLAPAEIEAIAGQVGERVRALPGVEGAAFAMYAPLTRYSHMLTLRRVGEGPAEGRPVRLNPVEAGYFETVGLALLRGRAFRPEDRRGPPVVVVNETLAERLFGGQAVGESLRLGEGEEGEEGEGGAGAASYRVIGVVEDGKYGGPREDPMPYLYTSLAQEPTPRLMLHVRAAGAAEGAVEGLVPVLEETVGRVRRDLRPEAETLRARFEDALWSARLAAGAAGLLGLLGLILVGTGIYSTVAAAVRGREGELAVRSALGARRPVLVGQVLVGTLRPLAGGLALGLALVVALGLWVTPRLDGLLHGMRPWSPWVLGLTVVFIPLLGLLASLWPAWRGASNADPRKALG